MKNNTLIIIVLIAVALFIAYQLFVPKKTVSVIAVDPNIDPVVSRNPAYVPGTDNTNNLNEQLIKTTAEEYCKKHGGTWNAATQKCIAYADPDTTNSGVQKTTTSNFNCSESNLINLKAKVDQLKINAGVASTNLNSNNTPANQQLVANLNAQVAAAINTYNTVALQCGVPPIMAETKEVIKKKPLQTYTGPIVSANGNVANVSNDKPFIRL